MLRELPFKARQQVFRGPVTVNPKQCNNMGREQDTPMPIFFNTAIAEFRKGGLKLDWQPLPVLQ
ncbi:hypothetical protein D3C81_1227770 [compost metagenome]